MLLLYTDSTLKTIFPQGFINSVFKINQSLKRLLALFLYSSKKVIRTNSITSCNKRDICKNYLSCSNYFTCSITSRRFYTSGVLHCNCINLICLISCKNCFEQNVGSATNLKNRFRIHKSDIKTSKERRGTPTHFNGNCKNNSNIFQFLSAKLLNKFMVMPQTLKKFMAQGKILAKPVICY